MLEDEQKVKAYKFEGDRTLAALEQFAVNEGYKKVPLSAYLPLNQKSIQDWGRWLAMKKIKGMQFID